MVFKQTPTASNPYLQGIKRISVLLLGVLNNKITFNCLNKLCTELGLYRILDKCRVYSIPVPCCVR